jgi:glycosyltransferase involved in cell wall biosynthesis
MGRDDGLRDALSALASELGLADRVLLLPAYPHERALAACRAALMLVAPSRVEPFGLVVIEAAAVGTPVVACRVGGIPEIIEDNASGLLVEPDDVRGLADAIRRMLSEPELRNQFASALFQRVEANFTMTASFRALSELALTARGRS